MKYTSFALVIAVTLAASCKKKDPTPVQQPAAAPGTPPATTEMVSGLPLNPTTIDAYLYAGFLTDVSYSSGYNLSMFSAFGGSSRNLFANYDHQGDQPLVPGTELRGNVDVGNVTFSGNSVSKSASPTNSAYYSSFPSASSTLAKWKIDGGSGFSATEVEVTRGFPIVAMPPVYAINVNSGYAFKVTDFVNNYDSVSVRLTGYNKAPYGFSVQKMVGISTDSVRFTKAELLPAYQTYSSLYLTIKAFNYSNKTIAGKKFVFELSSKAYNKGVYLY